MSIIIIIIIIIISGYLNLLSFLNGRWPNSLQCDVHRFFFFFNKEMLVSNVQIYRSEHVHIHTKTQLNININGEKNINRNIIYV